MCYFVVVVGNRKYGPQHIHDRIFGVAKRHGEKEGPEQRSLEIFDHIPTDLERLLNHDAGKKKYEDVEGLLDVRRILRARVVVIKTVVGGVAVSAAVPGSGGGSGGVRRSIPIVGGCALGKKMRRISVDE